MSTDKTSSCNNQQLLNPITSKSPQHKTTSQSDTSLATCDWSSNPKAGQPNDWVLHKPKAGLSNTQKLVPEVASKRCVPTYVNDVAQTQQLVANPSTGFLNANKNNDAQPTEFIESLPCRRLGAWLQPEFTGKFWLFTVGGGRSSNQVHDRKRDSSVNLH
ncbi:hypothetical protein F511_18597 [Dorcoceras hygrometricum]|uniref:Uncharacterized protein n=1 Tax=Dorcoceras hygrometricum TaxID=472368 RepID=A0A2Z7AA66_9LAMI|nr:hypothetical protein F511_18597 [Dorcoceras hygrometricum]